MEKSPIRNIEETMRLIIRGTHALVFSEDDITLLMKMYANFGLHKSRENQILGTAGYIMRRNLKTQMKEKIDFV